MHAKLKLSEHRHSGRHLPHRHTSYPALGLLLLLCGLIVGGTTAGALADSHPPPQAGSVSLSGQMPAAPPAAPPQITNPRSGQHFSQTPITVSGTCSTGDLVEVYKNDLFAGAAQCTDKAFTMQIDLLYGTNTLVARAYDALDQASPDSAAVVVYYDAAPPQSSPLDFANLLGNQLLLKTNPVFRGAYPGVDYDVPVQVIGGQAPYSISVDWGDGKTDLLPRGVAGSFDLVHQYARPGTYQVTIKAADNSKQTAFLQVLVVVNGQAVGSAGQTGGTSSNQTLTLRLLMVWPLYLLALMAVAGFWMGEVREKRKLEHQGLLAPT